MHESRVIAILKDLVHVLPLPLTLLEIRMNWRDHHYGKELTGRSFLGLLRSAMR